MKHIGILGGTFNPLHLGHLFIGRAAAEAFELDSVLLTPCSVSPFKCGAPGLAPGADRLEMVRLSVVGDPLFEPCALELERGGISYAIDTVKTLRERRPRDRFSFIVGMDALRELCHWHKINELLTLCDFITVARPGVDMPITAEALAFSDEVRARLLDKVIQGRLCDISSSEIRRRIAEGRSIRYLVCPAVERYIQNGGLYAATGKKKE
ncbi:MAG: nicotinate-nucleotide adenylyltransferase [bacterium]